MPAIEEVILVDPSDQVIGSMEKLEAHEKGLLHRAFSVFVFNSKGELLMQQRALSKYHSAGLWTNSCCSHPRPGELISDAAKRRMIEEMGMDLKLEHKTSFIYKAEFDNGLTEHELDHIFTGQSDLSPEINPEEVNAFAWKSLEEIKHSIQESPELYTAWFKLALEKFF